MVGQVQHPPLTPDLLVQLYANGYFPMAESEDDDHVAIIAPHVRGILPIFDLHIPRRLGRTVRQSPYRVTINHAFADVIGACAQTRTPTRRDSWINGEIREAYTQAHQMGIAHSVEVWDTQRQLVGGLYGVALGQLFCGESMFSAARDASKIALVHLCARLWAGGYQLLDAQFPNAHLAQFGMQEVPQSSYVARVHELVMLRADFACAGQSQNSLLAQYFAARQQAGINHLTAPDALGGSTPSP